jgi:diguanylate cyclase (GGDEF)-like protein
MLPASTENSRLTEGQIRRFSGLRFSWPSFPSALERQFEEETSAKRSRRLWFEGLIAIGLFNLLLVADGVALGHSLLRAAVVRSLIVTPICLAICLGLRKNPNKVARELGVVFAVVLVGGAHLFLEANHGSVTAAYAQMTILAVVLFSNLVMRLRFPYAVLASILMLIGNGYFLRVDQTLSRQEEILGMGMMIPIVALTLIANYSAEREERLNYLLSKRDETLVRDLNRMNAQLKERSEIDALTGLPNRHAFDQMFATMWRLALKKGSALSVVVVDVDNFKHLNDNYGHLYGDQVLKRIGSLLEQALRAKDDFAARFGGEEFVILLPATHQAAAVQVAERLCKMVELAGFPPLGSNQKPHTATSIATVSCGVATAYPTSRDMSHRLLEAADLAMYQAKAEGRNRVCSAPGVSIPA